MLNHIHGHSHQGGASGSMQGWAKMYDTTVALVTLGQERKLRQATLNLAKIQPGERVLDIGCGTGTLALAVKAQVPGAQVTGVDVASDMVEAARRKARTTGLEATFQVGRIEDIPFPEAQFDVVLSSLMLHHIHGDTAQQQGLQEIRRVLRPGGRLLIVDVSPPKNWLVRRLGALLFGNGMLAHALSGAIPLLKQAGFVEITSGPAGLSFLDYLSGKKA